MEKALAVVLPLSILAFGCGGAQPQPKGECPSGTYLKDGNCLPLTDEQAEQRMSAPASSAPTSESSATGATEATPAAESSAASSSGQTPYDKEAVQIELRRSAAQAGANCGAATDDEGKATGPWGKATVTVTLGRNGRSRGVSVAPPFAGKPVGKCIEQAFARIVFPPYSATSDANVDWEVDVKPPKRK